MKILIASANPHKAKEISEILKTGNIQFLSLNDFPEIPDVIENGESVEDNALIKARAYNETTGLPVIADDTGLFVEVLNGEPGVYSARYASKNATYFDNCTKLINSLETGGYKNSPAYFKTVICYLIKSDEYWFYEGIVNGTVINQTRGTNGFGYDPMFIPMGYGKTYAQMTGEEKNLISHRARALENFRKQFLSR